MPIYEYNCGKCGNQFEALVKNMESAPKKCPTCGSAKIKKIFSAFAVGAASAPEPCETCPTAGPQCSSGVCPMAR